MQQRSTDEVFLTSEQVRARYHISTATLWRWENARDNGFPAPLRVSSKRLYKLTDLEAWEASRMAVAS